MSPRTQATTAVTSDAMTEVEATSTGWKTPSIPIDVSTAKTPPAGVNPPYMHD
jgi:hypothetical protein